MIKKLYGEGICEALRKGGFVRPAVLHSKRHPEGITHLVIDFAACDAEKWNKEKKVLLDMGVIDCGKRGPDGRYGVRRDYTDTEKAELSLYPVQFSEDGNCMSWCDTQGYNERPAFYASCALPDTVLTLNLGNTNYCLQNGKCIPAERLYTRKGKS